jgi:hypothetical protein
VAVVTLYLPWCGPNQLANQQLGAQLLNGVGLASDSSPSSSVRFLSIACAEAARRALGASGSGTNHSGGRALGAYPQGLTFDPASGLVVATQGAPNAAIDTGASSLVTLLLPAVQNAWAAAADALAGSPQSPAGYAPRSLPSWYAEGALDPSFAAGSLERLTAATAASIIGESLGAAMGCAGASFMLGPSTRSPLQAYASGFAALTGALQPQAAFSCIGGAVGVSIVAPSSLAPPPPAAAAPAGPLSPALTIGLSVGLGAGGAVLLFCLAVLCAFRTRAKPAPQPPTPPPPPPHDATFDAASAALAELARARESFTQRNPLHSAKRGERERRRRRGVPAHRSSRAPVADPQLGLGNGSGAAAFTNYVSPFANPLTVLRASPAPAPALDEAAAAGFYSAIGSGGGGGGAGAGGESARGASAAPSPTRIAPPSPAPRLLYARPAGLIEQQPLPTIAPVSPPRAAPAGASLGPPPQLFVPPNPR